MPKNNNKSQNQGQNQKGNVQPIPQGYRTLNAYLTVSPCADAIEFYKKAFGAKELGRFPGPDGKIMHAELEFGDTRLMLSDEMPGMGCRTPKAVGAATSGLFLYVPDVDAAFKKALAAGAKTEMPVSDQFWGDRFGQVKDPFGHFWSIATHIEDVPDDEMRRRGQEYFAQQSLAKK